METDAGETNARDPRGKKATMIGAQSADLRRPARTWSIDGLEATCSKTTNADGIDVMPRLRETEDIQ
jgi:hypothetical protein